MSELDVKLAGKSLADFTNTQLRLALGAVLYTNTADMWKRYLNQLGYSGDVSQMLQKYYVEYSVPQNFRNYINAGAFIYSPQQLFTDGSKGVVYDNNDFVEPTSWRRNLLTYSEQFDNAGWTKSNASVTANAANNHLGVATADKLIPDAVSTQHRIDSPSAPVSSTTAYTVSCHAKADGYGFLVLRLRDAVSTADAIFNLSTGVVGAITISSWSAGSSSIESLGSGWYRCSFTATSNAAGATAGTGVCRINVGNPSSNGDISAWAGNGTDGILIWGAQVEVGSTATTYQRITDFNSDFLAAFPSTTLYLDSAGTTAATVNGLVGLQLDKSAGLVLGAERLTNGDFASGSASWSVTGNDATHVATFSGGTLRFQSDTTSPQLIVGQASALEANKSYQITVVISSWTSGSIKIEGTGFSYGVPAAAGTYTFIGTTNGASPLNITRASTGVDLVIDSVTVKELPGNHRYQTTTGSKPVLRGTPVGSSLVTNGDFATDTVWAKGSGWSIGSGVATKVAGTTNSLLQSVSVTAGKVYRLTYTITATAGGVQPLFSGGTSAFGVLRTASGTYVEWLTANTGNVDFGFTVNALFAGTVDNVEIVDVSAGSVTAPYGLQYDGVDDFLQTAAVDFTTVTSDGLARRNLLLSPSAFDDLVWPKTSISVSANITTAPDGTLNADKLVEAVSAATTHSIGQGFSFVNGVTYTFSAYIKKAERDWAVIQFNSAPFVDGNARTLYVDSNTGTIGTIPAGATATVLDAGNGWWRFSLTTTATQSATGAVSIYTASGNNGASYVGDGTSGLFVWGAQLEVSSTASAFQNIGTDKMFVCAGVRALASASSAIFVESSVNVGSNAGSFYISMPESANNIGHRFRGSLAGGTGSVSGYTAPYTRVISLIGDIAGDVNTLRANGADIGTSAVDQGTGTLGNYAIYFGRRAGTSLPYNGLDFGMVICGKTLTSTQISQTERYIAQRTGIAL